jgi:hypothetical protein
VRLRSRWSVVSSRFEDEILCPLANGRLGEEEVARRLAAEDDDGSGRGGRADLGDEVDATGIGQQKVEQDRVERRGAQLLEACFQRLDPGDHERIGVGEQGLDEPGIRGIVLDQQNLEFVGRGLLHRHSRCG